MPPAQEKVVVSRSGNMCAYPECGAELVIDGKHAEDRPKAVGKVAHIAAASSGGPRFDETMTKTQRGSADNLMYLCGPHHDAIDSQLGFHTREFLADAKKGHEASVARALRQAMGDVTYAELTLVCQVVGSQSTSNASTGGSIDLALPVQDKIELNSLGPTSSQRITNGLSQASRVADFVTFQCQWDNGFGRSLAARAKSDYYHALALGLAPDEVFDYIVEAASENAGPVDTPEIRAAALAVVAYLFELCEIFEHV